MRKSRDAFRTISEVSDWLDTPSHVLRFWESKFSQIKPVKRAGGRRYYRPDDMSLLGGIKNLLHDQGMTIKGVQKILREQGAKHVHTFSPLLPGEQAKIVETLDGIEARVASEAPVEPDETPTPTYELAEPEQSAIVQLNLVEEQNVTVDVTPPSEDPVSAPESPEQVDTSPSTALPSFLAQRSDPAPSGMDQSAEDDAETPQPDPLATIAHIARDASDPQLAPSVLHALAALPKGALARHRDQFAPILAQLQSLHERMAAR